LLGAEVCVYFTGMGWLVHEIHKKQRAVLLGP
jgi:hypothetical protein